MISINAEMDSVTTLGFFTKSKWNFSNLMRCSSFAALPASLLCLPFGRPINFNGIMTAVIILIIMIIIINQSEFGAYIA